MNINYQKYINDYDMYRIKVWEQINNFDKDIDNIFNNIQY